MISTWELTNVAKAVILPPGILILLALIGVGLVKASPRFGKWLAGMAMLALLALSLPIVAGSLIRTLEPRYKDPALDGRGGAIVVLGGGTNARAPEYGRDTVGAESLRRLRYAAHLHKRTKKPILVTSGNPAGLDSTEAAQMQAVLREFGVPVVWVEDQSNNTLENARFSQRILSKAGIKTVYVVTNAWHMPRAVFAFEQSGFTVIPAPTAYKTHVRMTALDFVPSAYALADSSQYFHEVAGLAWYRLKFRHAK